MIQKNDFHKKMCKIINACPAKIGRFVLLTGYLILAIHCFFFVLVFELLDHIFSQDTIDRYKQAWKGEMD